MQRNILPSHSEILRDIISWRNKSFCVRPFLSLTAHQDGAYRLCCEDEKVINNHTLGNIQNLQIHEMKNSPKIREIRKKMLEWKYITECSRCSLKESRGVASLREKSNFQYFKKYLERVVYSSNIYTWETTHPFIHADIRFSNICNLACRMCYSWSSSSRIELDKRLWNQVHGIIQNIWKIEDFSAVISELREIYIAWGEPFIDKNFIPFLKYLIDSGRSKKIVVTINTNLTIFSEEHRSLLSYFKKVIIVVSCDGYGNMYEYIRIWAKWDIFLKNLIFLKKSMSYFWEWSGITMNTVVQVDNIINILQLIWFCNKMQIRHNLSVLQVPDTMYIWVVPLKQKTAILKAYNDFIHKNKLIIPNLEEKLREIINILSNFKDHDPHLYNKFLEQTWIINWYYDEIKTKV